jgi:paraquat-inducible protein B
MKDKFNPTLVGAFVLGALILIVIGLVSFGSMRLFSKPGRFIAYFNESVQGLDLGSAVKLRGVRVGRVAGVEVRYDPETQKSKVAVICELEDNRVTDSKGKIIDLTDPAALQKLIDDGLRAKMRLTGITGMQIIELDFSKTDKPEASPSKDQTGFPVVPTTPSDFTELSDSLSEILKSLKAMDLAGVTRDLQGLITNVNAKVTSIDLTNMIARVTAAADAFGKLSGGPETTATITNINLTVNSLRNLATKLDTQVDALAGQARETLQSFDRAAGSVQQTLGPEGGLRDEAVTALKQLSEAAASIQRLADYLERNPNAIITGKKPPK